LPSSSRSVRHSVLDDMKRPRFLSRSLRLALILVLAACAREEMPPGTGPDFEPPVVTETLPPEAIREDAIERLEEKIGSFNIGSVISRIRS